MNSKVLIAAIVGGIFYFLLGWLVFGILLADSMESGMNENMKLIMRDMDSYVIWAFGVSNFVYALLLALIFDRFGAKTFMKGATNGAWIGLLISLCMDFGWYAQTTIYEMNMIGMDALFSLIMGALVGGVVGWMLGMGKKEKAAA